MTNHTLTKKIVMYKAQQIRKSQFSCKSLLHFLMITFIASSLHSCKKKANSTATNKDQYAKIPIGNVVYIDPSNREFANTEIAIVKYSTVDNKNARRGIATDVNMYSASVGAFIYSNDWSVCKQQRV
jgi:hypothetical protein